MDTATANSNDVGREYFVRPRLLFAVVSAIVLSACVNTPAQYKPAGFQTTDEVREYLPNYLYFAKKVSHREWESFYNRFPEYWKDLQTAKQLGGSLEFHPWYTAYAFRWSTLQRRKEWWSSDTISRLERRDVRAGDDIFKVVMGRGVPTRVIWDNDFEILLYKSGEALIFDQGTLARVVACKGCAEIDNPGSTDGMSEDEVVKLVGLERPKY